MKLKNKLKNTQNRIIIYKWSEFFLKYEQISVRGEVSFYKQHIIL